MSKKTVIIYFSQSGNTEKLVKLIHGHIGGATASLDEKGNIANSSDTPFDLGNYDTVLIGTPNWAATASTPVKTFLSANDLSGKDFAPVCTHGMGGEQNVTSDMVALCPNSKILPSLAVKGAEVDASGSKVIDWLQVIGLK
ncbi:MAG: hypothetical protein LBN43_07395 [Oscillospiraceae bacterium]|jgi:flavodoxin|nr:hypothetical protein [Oscillospiraceae bacterium]